MKDIAVAKEWRA